MCPEFGEDMSFRFKSYNYLSEIGPRLYERFYAPLQT